MKLQTTSHIDLRTDSGSLIVEAMLAISLISIFVVTSLTLVWSARALRPILAEKSEMLSGLSLERTSSTTAGFLASWYGDDTDQITFASSTDISILASNYRTAFGASSCLPFFNLSFPVSGYTNYLVEQPQSFLGVNAVATDIVAHNNFVYLSVDSTIQTDPDLYVIAGTDTARIVSSLDTGPGLSALTVAGHYVYAANTSITGQLEIIEILDRAHPFLFSKLKLPLPTATTTPAHATAIAYSEGFVYLGTDKWEGPEISIIDVRDPSNPQIIGSFEVGTTVEHIAVKSGFAYIATAGAQELVMLDTRDPEHILTLNSLSPAGWQIEEGKRILLQHSVLWYGRAGGGFNTSGYNELFKAPFTANSTSTHVAGGIYGMAVIEPYLFTATGYGGGTLDVWRMDMSVKLFSVPLNALPIAMSCDGNDMFIATGSQRGFVKVHFNL